MMDRKDRVKHFIEQLSQGQPLSQVRAAFKKEFQSVPADEIAEAERRLMQEGMPLEEVQRLCDVHASLFEGAVESQGEPEVPGHPLFIFSKENEALSRLLDAVIQPAYLAYEKDPEAHKEKLAAGLKELEPINRHYSRKENLFFPYLEQAGVTAPPKVMWGVDDEIRGLLRQASHAVQSGDSQQACRLLPELLEQVRNMVVKEEEILLPLLRKHVPQDAWQVIAGESAQIGFAFAMGVEGASPSDAQAFAKSGSANPLPRNQAPIQLPSGSFELEELRCLLNTLPCDITFVAADDTVHFFSEQEHRIFPRTRTIIGRKVADCHPPKSLQQVNQLIEAFKSGAKDREDYWIQRNGQFILIRYFAVRDAQGRYLGVLECTEEISALRSLTGDKTLMG